ncbi:MAG: primosomal protein N' [Sphaerochaetaceae bacterium]|nr:primosomal protein N' [Sphaerochaetaceae bacterium]
MMFLTCLVPIPVDGEFTYSYDEEKQAVKPGFRVTVPFGKRTVTGFVISISKECNSDFEIKPIKKVIDKSEVFTPELVDLASWMASFYMCSRGQVLSAMIPSGKRETESSIFDSEESFIPVEKLHFQQEEALERIRKGKGLYYLFGVTGSGKSEVYLRACEEVIAKGKQVIYLVPEITLTHQLANDVIARFKNRVAILHSALTPSQRLKYWHDIMTHKVDLVIGARSAIFAPCKELGLIILDEEHENSYKSGNTPRYHARQVAQYRASKCGATMIMGSATPSMEAYLMMKKGLVERIDMPYKVAGGREPNIEIVSLLGEERSISRPLEKAIGDALIEKRGVILFLNRRGYTYYYHCNSCGEVAMCPNCSVALTYHKSLNRLHCHYCGYTEKLKKVCTKCGSTDLSVSGFGTEKVEEEVRKLFPSARIERLDTDSVSGDKEKAKKVIEDFKKGDVDILLGTQMVAKGLNFPLLKLVGVINADSTLSIPDFRAEERTFALLKQVAGRAGRYQDDGRVIIQTNRSEDEAIKAVMFSRTKEFYDRELEVRQLLGYPPFSRLLALTTRSKSEENSERSANELGSIIEKITETIDEDKRPRIIGIQPCIISKKAGSYRHQILISSYSAALLPRIVSRALELYKVPSGVYLEVDIDPLSLL